jgi:hypothetical protein
MGAHYKPFFTQRVILRALVSYVDCSLEQHKTILRCTFTRGKGTLQEDSVTPASLLLLSTEVTASMTEGQRQRRGGRKTNE